jgi:hypothetical protein
MIHSCHCNKLVDHKIEMLVEVLGSRQAGKYTSKPRLLLFESNSGLWGMHASLSSGRTIVTGDRMLKLSISVIVVKNRVNWWVLKRFCEFRSKPVTKHRGRVVWHTCFKFGRSTFSDLGLETGYPDWGFCGVSQSLQANAEILPRMRSLPLPSKFLPIHHSLIKYSFDAK